MHKSGLAPENLKRSCGRPPDGYIGSFANEAIESVRGSVSGVLQNLT
jgi:hypothetical protein